MKHSRLRLVGSDAIRVLPYAVQELARAAFHATELRFGSLCADERLASHEQIDGLIQQAIDLAGEKKMTGPRGNPHSWLLVLHMLVHVQQSELSKKWPSPTYRFDGKVLARTLSQRLFASVALWRLDLAIQAYKKADQKTAIAEVAIAGMALAMSGSFGASELSDMNESETRRKAARNRWADDPTQIMKADIQREWESWQLNRSAYRKPRDFRLAMIDKFPQANDGTMKNWMSEWASKKKASS